MAGPPANADRPGQGAERGMALCLGIEPEPTPADQRGRRSGARGTGADRHHHRTAENVMADGKDRSQAQAVQAQAVQAEAVQAEAAETRDGKSAAGNSEAGKSG